MILAVRHCDRHIEGSEDSTTVVRSGGGTYLFLPGFYREFNNMIIIFYEKVMGLVKVSLSLEI